MSEEVKRAVLNGELVAIRDVPPDWDVETLVGPPMTELELRSFRQEAERLKKEEEYRKAIEYAHDEALDMEEARWLEATRMTVSDVMDRLSGQDPAAFVQMDSWDDDDGYVRDVVVGAGRVYLHPRPVKPGGSE